MTLEIIATVLLCSAGYEIMKVIVFDLCDRAWAWWLARCWRKRWKR